MEGSWSKALSTTLEFNIQEGVGKAFERYQSVSQPVPHPKLAFQPAALSASQQLLGGGIEDGVYPWLDPSCSRP